MRQPEESLPSILPRSKRWWLGLALLLVLAGWLYLRGFDVSLPYFDHIDEPVHLAAAQHIIDFGTARGLNNHDTYPPGMNAINYLLLKHVKPAEAHHGTMLPALRLLSITAWMLAVVVIALLGSLMAHPLTGLMAGAIWIVNPWVVQRAHFALPDGYLTLFTLLSLYLALIGGLHGRRSFSIAAVYSLMLAIVFKTTAIFVAPFVLFLPLVALRRPAAAHVDGWQQVFWNCVRFAVFLFWLLLIYPTLDVYRIDSFPVKGHHFVAPQLQVLIYKYLVQVLRTFQPLTGWAGIAIAGVLIFRYRRKVDPIAILTVSLATLAWLVGMSIWLVDEADAGVQLRQLFVAGALLSLLYGASLTALFYAGQEALARNSSLPLSPRRQKMLVLSVLAILLGIGLLPAYRESDALAHNYSLPDRRNDLARYMDNSLPPDVYVSNSENYLILNRSWGGYDGVHNFPRYKQVDFLANKFIEEWRALGVEYAIMAHWKILENPDIYYPDETVLLKTYPVDSRFRGPNMVVLRLYPMQNFHDGKLGSIRLLGYDINGSLFEAGANLVFRHYWQAAKPSESALHVYNHLLNAAYEIVAQVDYVPLWDDRRPSTSWDDPDEIMLGREFTLSLPADLPPGEYTLITGFYDPQTGKRLISAAGDDRLIIATVTVSRAEP